MRLYGKKLLKRSMERQTETRTETRDGILYDVLEAQRLCRVKVQGSNTPIVAHYPENWEQTPGWLKPGNSVRIVHQSGIRGKIEVVGHGQTQPTGVSILPIAAGADAILTGCRLIACQNPRMAVYVLTGTFRIGGVIYTLEEILLGSGASLMLLGDGCPIDRTAGVVELNATPASGNYRYDLVSIGADGVIDYTAGTPATANPVKPSVAASHLACGYILLSSNDVVVTQGMINANLVPDTPPYTPPAITVPSGTMMAWGTTLSASPGVGVDVVFNFTVLPGKTHLSIDVYPIDLTVAGTAYFYFPDGVITNFAYSYGTSPHFDYRTQLAPYPNLSYQYLPEGIYALKLSSTGTGRTEVRAYFCS